MTDAHCHVTSGETRHLVCGEASTPDVSFVGLHPWNCDIDFDFGKMHERLAADLSLGVGEIGLDRLRSRTISSQMQAVFECQLMLAAEFRRPVVLHGAKCWGRVVQTILRLYPEKCPIPSFLFHGFSRSDGLMPAIIALNGFISIGPALLNDHAVNYRELAKKVPLDRLLIESDRTIENAGVIPSVTVIAEKLAELRGVAVVELTERMEANADAFLSP